jgi:phosphatidylserine decarboxylase
MRVSLTKYGLPQVVVLPAIVIAGMVVLILVFLGSLPGWAIVLLESVLAVLLVWLLAFFRDPYRAVPLDRNILLAPADGKITDVDVVDEDGFIGGPALRIGIFLNIFDVHINRAPCNAKVEKITHREGRYKNAMSSQSGRVNESNDLWLIRTDSPEDRLIVRQISGAIARRIVCSASEGQSLTGGEKFGMIKFGSRTELYIPLREDALCVVKAGDKVKAGVSVLVRYEK